MPNVVDLEAIRRCRRAVREGCKVVWHDDLGDVEDEQVFFTEEEAAEALSRMICHELAGGPHPLWIAADTGEVYYREVFPTRAGRRNRVRGNIRARFDDEGVVPKR